MVGFLRGDFEIFKPKGVGGVGWGGVGGIIEYRVIFFTRSHLKFILDFLQVSSIVRVTRGPMAPAT
jgi:hypothetical protein